VIPPDWADKAARPATPSPDAIKTAVRDTIDADMKDTKAEPDRRHEQDTLRADRYTQFGNDFDEARVPDCLHSDGLKRQPTGYGIFQLGGLLRLPFVLVAKLRGKCN